MILMQNILFSGILQMSLTASFVIVVVLVCRVLLKKAPKIFTYALWGVVLFRLLCPVSIDLPFSFVPNTVTERTALEQTPVTSDRKAAKTISLQYWGTHSPAINANTSQKNTADSMSKTTISDSHVTYETVLPVLANIWLAGIGIMLIYSVFSLLRLKRRLIGSVPYNPEERIYLSDYIETPFVIGLFRPRIYLPSHLNDTEIAYILLHEKHHIYRKDHLVKTLAYGALILHWFNPLAWAAFILSGKDMEMSCDEAVMKKMGGEICETYSTLLLRLATGKTIISPAPLAFGEGDTKARIHNILNWKKPSRWVMVLATLVCTVTALGCAANAKESGTAILQTFEKNEYIDAYEEYITSSAPFEDIDLGAHINPYEEYITTTYYKMSDGTWTADVEDATGNMETRTYKYRLVMHGTMPNAAVDSNYIILSNKKNITFQQTWMASGLSSNSNDYFDSKETIIVSSWLGELESEHPERDKDTIYIIDSEYSDGDADVNLDIASSVPILFRSDIPGIPAIKDMLISKVPTNEFDVIICLPDNSNWIKNTEYVQNTYKCLEISYLDNLAKADCTLLGMKDGTIDLGEYDFDDTLTEQWEGKTYSNQLVSVTVQQTADYKTAVVSWSYNEYEFAIFGTSLGGDLDTSYLAKTALYAIKSL